MHRQGPWHCPRTSEVGWRMTFKVVDTLTGRPQMAGRPFEEQPHELDRKWKVYTGNSSIQYYLAIKAWKKGKFCRNVLDIFYLYIYLDKN